MKIHCSWCITILGYPHIHMKTPVLESHFTKVAHLQACNGMKKRCFLVNITKSLITSILKIICEGLLLLLELFCKDCVNIRYGNALFGILEHPIWLQLIYYNCFLAYEISLSDRWDSLSALAKYFTLCSIYRLNQPFWENHGIAYEVQFQLQYSWWIKSSKNFSQDHVMPRLFFKIALGTRLNRPRPLNYGWLKRGYQ